MQYIYSCAASEFERLDLAEKIFFSCAESLPPAIQFLSDSELAALGKLKLHKRRLEWQAGRLAAKKLVNSLTGIPIRELEVSYDDHHRPICGGKLISITHSGGLAAAAYSESSLIGIDLEVIKPHSQAWLRDYFFEDEVPNAENEEAIMAWTRKEAVLKALGIGLTVSAKEVNVAGKKPFFLGKALERFKKLGSPDIAIKTAKSGKWYFSAAAGLLKS